MKRAKRRLVYFRPKLQQAWDDYRLIQILSTIVIPDQTSIGWGQKISSLSVEMAILSFIETRLVVNQAEISISRTQEQVCFLSCLVKIQFSADTSFMMHKACVWLLELFNYFSLWWWTNLCTFIEPFRKITHRKITPKEYILHAKYYIWCVKNESNT